ncbi:uncharacterized protein B0H18DRAFT_950154 [Fomitopsis serialis]|uniref:uncharacterized protein n=1 Tax=Fomitopsis serialis TaxID=139415 RepID=UPI00200874BC|nr:uncharacterized protein B0H18DRAFT_950154 [Neoantrodia serialis]KAH9937225.1 hypothetical protein B0H18DRAFT_950154 [Neoantrodia serialis]
MGVGARILGRGKSQTKANGGKGPLSRKAPPKNADPSIPSLSEKPSPTPSESRSSTSGNDKDSSSLRSDDQHYYSRLFSHLPPNSLIPDALAELPPWFKTDTEAWNVASLISFRSRYPMHNPAGPRWYQNVHLLAPTENQTSQFSASFPPIPTAAERSQESTRLRTPSASPLPTPNSSQLRIVDPTGRVRTRKISQTDNVDMLDGTDPWGQQWHHDSPYDIGGLNHDASPETEDRRRSLTIGNRHKSVTPSPLSQSTSAVHLHMPEPMGADLPRRMSKRRKPFSGLFGSQSQDNFHPKHASAPHEPPSPLTTESVQRQNVLRRRSTAGPPPPSPSALLSADMASGKKEKHTSFMGRLARRFSVMRKPDPVQTANGIGGDSPLDGANAESSAAAEQVNDNADSTRTPDPSRRVPAPAVTGDPSTEADRVQSSALYSADDEEPVPSKLTVVNPDEPDSSVGASPVQLAATVPSESSAADTESSSKADADVSEMDDRSEGTDTPAAASRATITETPASPSTIPSTSQEPVSPLQIPSLSPSLPLPELPQQSLAAALNLDHSLPPTPRTERPLSLVSERTEPSTAFLSSPRTQTQETNFSSSSTNLTAYAPSSVTTPDDPSLVRASIVANPPTPHVRPMVIFPSAKATQVPMSSSPVEMSPKPREGSPKKEGHHKSSSTTKRRETETYTLVRSPSGTARAAGDVITAMGEQWELVSSQAEEGSRKSRRKERSGSKEVESPIREEGEYHHHKRQRSVNEQRPAAEPMTASSSRSTRTPSVDTERRPHGTVSSRKERRSSSKHRESDADAGHSVKATSVPNPHHPYRHERALSAGARPASDLQFDPMVLKAKDAWEQDRLWKANSVSYGPDGIPIVSTPPTIGDGSRTSTVVSADMQMAGAIPSTSDLYLHRATTLPSPHTPAPPHGSSHTYFTIGPYQGSHTIPPVYVPNVAPSAQNPSAPGRRRQVSRSFSERVPFSINDKRNDPPSLTRNYIGNPLPDPPRISPFQAAPLPPSLVAPLGSANAQYAGVPTRY